MTSRASGGDPRTDDEAAAGLMVRVELAAQGGYPFTQPGQARLAPTGRARARGVLRSGPVLSKRDDLQAHASYFVIGAGAAERLAPVVADLSGR